MKNAIAALLILLPVAIDLAGCKSLPGGERRVRHARSRCAQSRALREFPSPKGSWGRSGSCRQIR